MSAYRDDVDALEARRAALAVEVEAKRRELDEASRLLAQSKARASLPVLDDIRVATPCSEPWSQMTGDARVRSCDACQQRVYDISELTRDEVQALIVEREGALCVRYYQRHDGTILLKDCAIGVQRTRTRTRRLVAVGAVALLTGGAVGLRALQGRVEARAVASETCDSPAAPPDRDDPGERARQHDEAARAAHLRSMDTVQGLLVSPEELTVQNHVLAGALAETKADRARLVAERTAAKARLEAAVADAEAAARDAEAALRARQAAEAELEATRARARELEQRLGHAPSAPADDLKP